MKCEICKNKIGEIFLNKPLGTYIYDDKHKKQLVCFECQSRFNNDKQKMLEAMK
jgi:selenophosphate synthase